MDAVSLLAQVLPGLTLVVGGLLAVRWWVNRGGARRTGPAIRVVGRTSLSRNSLVAVVDVGGRRFLIGSGDQGTTLLAELPEGEAAEGAVDGERTPDAVGATAATGSDLPDLLHDLTQRRSPGWDRPAPGPRNGLLDRLRAMTVRAPVARPPGALELLRR